MKNIGLKLKDKREENGLSIEEVAEDLKMRPSQRILDEFNEYLFDMTSKIPIELIKEAKKDKNENNDTISPYTKESSKIKVPKIIIGLAVIVILIVVGYFIVSNYKGNDFSDNDITYSIRR